MAMLIHPFDPAKNKPRKNADGSHSTEITRTVQLPDGSWANVPSLWWGDGETVRDFGSMTDDQLAGLAARYEAEAGTRFPRYRDLSEAEKAAKQRSAGGGGTGGSLAANPARTEGSTPVGSGFRGGLAELMGYAAPPPVNGGLAGILQGLNKPEQDDGLIGLLMRGPLGPTR